MSHRLYCRVAVVALVVLAQVGRADRIIAVPVPTKPVTQAMQAGVIVLGKVAEIEKDTVWVAPYRGAGKEQNVAYKIAVLKIEDPLVGARGLTQLRVGFLADSPAHVDPALPRTAVGVRRGNMAGSVALTAEMDGLFMLVPHQTGDFYVIVINGDPLLKKDLNYAKDSEAVKKIAAAIDDPVTALKSKNKDDRAMAAQTLLIRHQTRPLSAKVTDEDISPEENKLILQVIAELPWTPEGSDNSKPSRSGLWKYLHTEELGFVPPVFNSKNQAEFNKQWEEATKTFLSENAGKIKIKKLVAGK
ncbi:hypothetical protein [Zavarzinella formosa]|uniref:hypothetical protein n=1 Tax=Zavarzinella formosa TaxID=360055 RepID=UPI0012F959D4|nr:hypothetical protein [Zavarzinella formosa]